MFPYILEIGAIKISTVGFFSAISFVAASFLLWKQLRDDYPEEDILTFTLYLFLSVLIGARIIYIIEHWSIFGFSVANWLLWGKYPGFSLLGGLIGASVFNYLWSKNKGWDLWLIADKLITSFLLVNLLVGFGLMLSSPNLNLLIFLILIILLTALTIIISGRYRKILCYKSGKVGFTGCAGISLYFLTLSLLVFIQKNSIYWTGLLYLFIAFLSLAILYARSERKWREDLKLNFNRK